MMRSCCHERERAGTGEDVRGTIYHKISQFHYISRHSLANYVIKSFTVVKRYTGDQRHHLDCCDKRVFFIQLVGWRYPEGDKNRRGIIRRKIVKSSDENF